MEINTQEIGSVQENLGEKEALVQTMELAKKLKAGDKEAESKLIEMLGSPFDSVRQAAFGFLGPEATYFGRSDLILTLCEVFVRDPRNVSFFSVSDPYCL